MFGISKRRKLLYFTECHNFGDILNEDLMRFFGCRFRAGAATRADIVAIGSMMEWILSGTCKNNRTRKPIHVFGSGFIMPARDKNETFARNVEIHALRGKITRARCESILGKKFGNIPLGDPGLLVRYIFPNVSTPKKYDVGIICHYVDKDSPLLQNIKLKKLSYRFIDIQSSPAEFVRAINECGFILSSTMHGLICADSYGIPNRHIVLSDRVVGGEYKFRDYYSVFNNFKYNPVYLSKTKIADKDIAKFIREYTITNAAVDKICKRLIAAFPFNHGGKI